MKKFQILLTVSFFLATAFISSCKKDETTPDAPKVTSPSSTTDVQVSQSTDITFTVDVPGGFSSATATANGGTVTVKSSPEASAKSGSVVVTFSADATVGAGSVTLEVMDKNKKTDDASAAVNKTAEPVVVIPTRDIYSSDNGTGTVTWYKDTIYILRGFVFVNDGQTLTIQAGTVIKGQPGQGSGASALIVARGGKIMANGTAAAPIIMTGLADDLNGSVPDDANSLWGGLIILGKASTSNMAEGNDKSIEGIPETESRGHYGGGATPDDADNSGSITYLSVRHGGSVIGADNEINGISLGAVGSGTVLDHIEVFCNFDDGIEFFGGDPNLTNVVLTYTGDDGLDQDEGFHGKVQYALVWKKASTNESSDPRGAELDGGVDTNEPLKPFSTPKMSNITLYGEGTNSQAASSKQTFYMRDGWGGCFFNSIFYGFDGPIDMERRTDKINPTDNKSASSYDQWVSVANGGYGNLKIEKNLIYTNGVTTNDAAGFAAVFQLSDETDAAKELEVEQYLMANNKIVDPGFGTGAAKFTPSTADATADIMDVSSYGLTTPTYKGAVAPTGDPFFKGWTRTWEVISQ